MGLLILNDPNSCHFYLLVVAMPVSKPYPIYAYKRASMTTRSDDLSYKKKCADSGENGDSKCIPLSHLQEIVRQRHKMSDIEGEC